MPFSIPQSFIPDIANLRVVVITYYCLEGHHLGLIKQDTYSEDQRC